MRTSFGALLLLCFVVGCFAQFGPLPVNCPQHPEPVPLPDELPSTLTNMFDELDLILEEFMNATGVSATSVGIVYDQQLVYGRGFGTLNKKVSNSPAASIDTMYRVGSITKVFTVLMLLQLRDEGKLNLDDPVSKYWPTFNVTSPYRNNQGITFRELATQLSGLFSGSPCDYTTGCNITTDEAFELISPEEVLFPTDYYPHYSDLAFAIIGRALEPLAGMSWEQFVQERLFNPLNMTNTGNVYTQQVKNEIAQSFINGTSIPLFISCTDLEWARPTGNAYSTVRDLANFLMMFFRDSDPGQPEPIVSRASLREMLLPDYVNDDLYSGFSMPWENFYASKTQTWFHTKGGLFPGYTTFIMVKPEFKVGFIIQQNDLFAASLGQALTDTVLNAFQETFAELAPPPALPTNVTKFVGVYKYRFEIFIPITLNVTYDGQTLLVSGFGGDSVLQWVSGNTFRVFPTGPIPCINVEIGIFEEFVFFQSDSNGDIVSLTKPGMDGFFGIVFEKTT
eukprot:TRINITY_DN4312_c0_g1_i2.p1 TRINITY_DN4312_c0_g1~~TRINITY_DN4312_c0_g1_i2.p1  ORF type:complete len:508 (-),score=122.73 TRINITY_DN4312_c0_g1_i2:215-1738(-)